LLLTSVANTENTHVRRNKFEKYPQFSFFIKTSDGAETISTPSPTNTPFLSSSHPIIQPTSVGSFNIDALAMPTHPSTRPQHPFHLSSFPYPYNLHSLLKFSMSLPAHNPVFGRGKRTLKLQILVYI